MSRRGEQIASVLHREIQAVLVRGLSDPRLESMMTVTGVHVCDDLSEAVISVSVIPEAKGDITLHGLRAAAGHIRREAGKRIELWRLPRLQFKLDRSLKREAGILATLAEIEQEHTGGEDSSTEDASTQTPSVAPEEQ